MKGLLIIILLVPILSFGQYSPKEESNFAKNELSELTDYKNTIRWNITPFMIFGYRNINLGYERVLSDKNTVSVNVGYLEIPKLLTQSEKVEYIDGDSYRGGFSIFADYNFYIANRNVRKAPEGVYWGVFAGIYNQKFGTNFNLVDENNGNIALANADLKATVNNLNLGMQLGYQFVFYDRFTVDLVLVGPALSFYTGKLSGDIEIYDENIEENEIYKEFVNMIMNKAPWLADVVDEKEISAKGGKSNFSLFGGNFRYVLQIGYRF
ncbi:MAG: hypothetical protein ABFR62_06525 [Bacteroidota bacterium]